MSHISLEDLESKLASGSLKIGKSGRAIKLLLDKSPLQLITCKMYSPFGVKVNNSDYSYFTNCVLDSSISTGQPSSELFIKAFENLDNKLIDLIKSSKSMLNKADTDIDFSDDNFYSPIFKGNGNYPKLMKISLPRDKNGNFDFVIFDENKEKVPVKDSNIEQKLPKGISFRAIIECSKIWVYKGRIGTTWNLIQMRFIKNERPIAASDDGTDGPDGASKDQTKNAPGIYTQPFFDL